MRGFEKNLFGPLLCAVRFLAVVPGRAHAIEKFVLPVSHVLHQNETTAG
jgi:hypothetical protein